MTRWHSCIRGNFKNVFRCRRGYQSTESGRYQEDRYCNLEELDEKAEVLLNKIQALNIDADIQKEKNVSQVGGGSMPLEKLDTYTVII